MRRSGRIALVASFAATLSVSLSAGPARAALGDHLWSAGFDVGSSRAVTADGSGHVVASGMFFGTVDFGGGPMTAGNFLGGDLYLARFQTNGSHSWSLQVTPNASFGISDQAICTDVADNIYLAGRLLGGDIDFGGGTIAGGQAFLAKFDASGNHVWSAGYGDGTIKSIATDGAHLVVVGYTSVGVDFGGGTVGTAGGNDAFVAKLTTAGAHVWSAGFGDTDGQAAFGVSIDGAGNVVVVGSMFGTVDFGGGPLVANLLDLYLVSFTSTGVHSWSEVFDGVFTPGGGILVSASVDTGPTNEIVIAGEMRQSVDFGGGLLTSSGFSDMYVAKFDAAGTHLWSAVHGGTDGTENAMSVSIDGSGNVLACGTFSSSSASFGGTTFPVTGSTSPFAAIYDGAGAHVYSNGFATTVYSCAGRFDSAGDLILDGDGWPSVDFGGGPVSPAGLVIAKLQGQGGGSTGVEAVSSSRVALAAHPNPFRPATRIQYTLDAPALASVTAYDVRGRRIETLVPARRHAAGNHEVTFAARGAAGVYFLRLETEAGGRTIRVVELR